MNEKQSNLINIPTGSPFWAEPLMKNLYILEELIENADGGGAGDLWLEIEKLQDRHQEDVFEIERRLNEIFTIVVGDHEGDGLASQVKMHETDITKIYELLDSIDTLTIDEVLVAIEDVVKPIKSKIKKLEDDASISQEEIKIIQMQGIALRDKVQGLEKAIDEIKANNKDFHHIVSTEQEMNAITQKGQGSLCFVRSEMQLFVWDGKWVPTSPDHSIKKIQWADIVDAPMAQPTTIDTAVSLMHTHNNKTALDTITFSTINNWDSKAEVSAIPTKLSDLEDDIGVGENYDEEIKEIQEHIGNMDGLATENKDSLVEALNEIHLKLSSINRIEKMVQELSEKVAYLEK